MFRTHLLKHTFEVKLACFLSHHPLAAFLFLFAGLPLSAFLAVSCFTLALVYPACLLLGLI